MKIRILSYLLYSILFTFVSCGKKEKISSRESQTASLDLELEKLNQLIEEDKTDILKLELNHFHQLAEESQNNYYLGKVYSIKGYLNLREHQNNSAFYHLNLAKRYFSEAKDSINIAKSLTNMAIIQSDLGDYSGSELTATEALGFLENQSDQSFISSVYNCLAISSFSQKNYEEAVYWYKLALNSTDDLYSKQLYKNNLAAAYLHNGNYSNSISELVSLLKQKNLKENAKLYSKVMDNLAYAQWKQNPATNPEADLKNALKLRETIDDKWGMIASHSHLSDFFTSVSKEKSLFHAEKMYENARLMNSPNDKLEALQKLIYAAEPQKAKGYALLYTELNDSMTRARNLSKDQFAKIRYDSESKRKENENLRAETAEQELEIQRRKLAGIIAFSVIVLMAGGAFAFFRIQKIKNQKRINDEIYATESKIAGKIHDNLANNIYRIMSDLENTSDQNLTQKKNIFLNQLDSVYKLARDISRENSPIETGENYEEELLSLISSYKNEKTNVVLMGFSDIKWENLGNEKQIQLYKVLQELLTNMKKHSQASLVVLRFQTEKNNLNIFYTDNGIGITDNQLNTKNGIRITENRIEKLKGSISFVGEPHKGLKVNLKIPL